MDIQIKSGSVLNEPSELGVFASYQDTPLPEQVAGLFEGADFRGRADETLLLYPQNAAGPRRLLLLGLGTRASVSPTTVRQAGAVAVQKARELKVSAITTGVNGDVPLPVPVTGQAFAEGIELGAYRYWHYRTGLSDDQTFRVERVTVMSKVDAAELSRGFGVGQAVAGGVILARNLVNHPGYALTPALLGDEAITLGKRLGLRVTVMKKDELIEQGFGGILAVGKGSENEPRFIVMEYGAPGDGKPTICLVGKGLTFDSGGLSLKPPEAMETMKSDMGGAAAVFGAMQVVAELKLPLHVVGIVSAAENMPSATAYRPGDIVRTLSGKTIEVLNTDAEGRIILADGLFFAQRYKPDAIVELSTLTGAIIIALGNRTTGMMATDAALAERVSRAGEATGERVWQLPLWDEYRQMIKSDVADIKNMAGRPAGSITAGAFLAEFTGDYPFVHLDVAGTAWTDRPATAFESQGGTGVGVRLLTDFLRNYQS